MSTLPARIDPSLAEIRHLAQRAINGLPPADPDTIPIEDHQLDCYTMAAVWVLAQRLGFEPRWARIEA